MAPPTISKPSGVGVGVTETHVDELVAYIEGLTVQQGHLAGEPMRVLPWQRGLCEMLVDDGGDCAMSLPRKVGKTTFISAVCAAALDGPLMIPRSEILVVSPTLAQSAVVARMAKWFLGEQALDRKRWRVLESSNRQEIHNLRDQVSLYLCAARPNGLHGRQPRLTIVDEAASFERSTRDKVHSVLRTSAGAIPGSRMVMIGTRPADPEHFFERSLRGERAIVYAAAPEDDWTDLDVWRRANPCLDHWPWLLPIYERECAEAQADSLLVPSFKALRLNAGTQDHSRALFCEAHEWAAAEVDDADLPPRRGPYALSFDLSDGWSMSACAAYWPQTHRLEALAAYPAVPSLQQRGKEDGVGTMYQDMAARGELLVQGERAVDVPGLVREAVTRWGRPTWIVADRYKQRDALDALAASGVPSAAFSTRGMGYRDASEDVRLAKAALVSRRVKVGRSLLLRSAFAELTTMADASGNRKICKSAEGGRRARARDDAGCTAILSIAEGVRRFQHGVPRKRRWAKAAPG